MHRVVVGIDFGTTHSGFAYAHKKNNNSEIFAHTNWQEYDGRIKTPTALLYDDEYKNVQAWGFSALAKRSRRKGKKIIDKKPVKLFKLHLSQMPNKPPLPIGLDYKKAITDYLHEFGKVVKETIIDHWEIDFFTLVLIVLTVPDEFDDNAIETMRECVFKAGLLEDQYSPNLQFTTESEAITIYNMKFLKEHSLSVGAKFIVVDCGGDIVDLTTCQLLEGGKISEIMERSKDHCGSNSVDQEFLKFIECKVGSSAINLLRENYCYQFEYMIQELRRRAKNKFTGVQSEFETLFFELDEICPILTECCKDGYLDNMEKAEWIVELKFEDIKRMFDPVIEKIIQLIDSQLRSSNNNYSALLISGEFSESKYFILRIKEEFSERVPDIIISCSPTTDIMKGAVLYGSKWIDDYGPELILQSQLTQSFDAIKNLKEVKKNCQTTIQECLNHYKTLNNCLQEKFASNIQQLENEKELDDDLYQKITNLENQLENLIQQNTLLEEEKKNYQVTIQECLNHYKTLNNCLQENFASNIQQLKNEKELNSKNDNLNQKVTNLEDQLEQQDTLLKDEASNLCIKFEEEKKKFQDKIQESNNILNRYKSSYNNLQEKYENVTNKNSEEMNQHQVIVEKLKNDIKEIERHHLKNVQQLENQISDINQQHQSEINLKEQKINQLQQSLELKENQYKNEIQNSNSNLDQYKLLYNNLQEKYGNLANKNNEEMNQHQIIVEKLKNDIKEIEKKISNINQQYQNENNLQKQKIDQLQTSLELKENQIHNLEKQKEELDNENDNLYQRNITLVNQLENQSTLLEDESSNHQLESAMNLNDSILELNDNLKEYVTDLKQDVIVNMEEVKKLLLLYKCPTRIINQEEDRLLIQAVLQRHVMETIFLYATKYFQSTGQHYHLESDIINKAHSLSTLLINASKHRTGNDEVTNVALTKLRQQIYLILNNHGFTDIFEDNATYEHPFIVYHKEQLNKIMNGLRIIKDDHVKTSSENLAATIIRKIVKIFWFGLKIQEPVVQYVWIPYNAKVDKTFMEETNFDDDTENSYVDLCYFPLTGKDLTTNNRKIYTPAKVFIRKDKG